MITRGLVVRDSKGTTTLDIRLPLLIIGAVNCQAVDAPS